MRTDKIPKIGVLYGTVIDSSSRKPIQYASVSVVSMRTNEIVTGGITNETGTFRITEIPLGQYDVVVEFIGYKREIIKSVMLTPRGDRIEQNLGKIELQLTSLQMEAVEVQGERPIYVQTAEKKIFNVEQNTVSSGGTLLDALRQVPGVDVDIDGKVSLRGNTNVNILIDGKPSIITSSDQEMMLEAIPADNIQDIEVITNPSAKYDPEGMAGIINIILKENKFAGLNGYIKAGASTNDAYNTSGQINFRNEKVNLFLNSALRNDIRSGSGGNYRETYSNDVTTILDQNISGERGGKSYLIKSGLELYPNLNNTIGLTLSYSNGDRIGDRTVETEETIIDSMIHYYRDTDADNDHTSLDMTLTYDRKFNKPKQKLSAFANHSTGTDNRTHSMISTANPEWPEFDADPERTTTDNEKNESNLQMDYIHPFSQDFKLEIGYKGTRRAFDNQFFTFDISQDGLNTETVDSSRSNHFLFDESIHAAYTQFSLQKGIFGLQMGLRGETVTTVSKLIDTGEKYENPYTSFFPGATLTIGPQILQMQLSYSRRIHRPSYRRLNPAIHQLDQYSIRTGNPFLKPEYIDVAEVGLSRFNNGFTTSVTAYYRRITDLISHHKLPPDSTGVTTMTYENYDQLQNYGLEFILSGSFGKGFRIMANGNLFSDEVDASSVFDNDDYDETSTGFFGRVSAIWNIAPSTELMLTGFYRSPRDIPIGSLNSMSFSSMSVKKKFMDDRLAVSLRLNDLFDTMGFGFTTESDNYFQESYRKFDSQIASISLEYHFGKMEDRSRFSQKRNKNNSDMGGFEIE
ncbi:MAG: TonB-dependent receptor [Candidatus Marinimicrobia bacterium]|nr:TonB-dependent receptor [Candidatus Neomarinimicrobiota bacterium]